MAIVISGAKTPVTLIALVVVTTVVLVARDVLELVRGRARLGVRAVVISGAKTPVTLIALELVKIPVLLSAQIIAPERALRLARMTVLAHAKTHARADVRGVRTHAPQHAHGIVIMIAGMHVGLRAKMIVLPVPELARVTAITGVPQPVWQKFMKHWVRILSWDFSRWPRT